MKSKPTIGVVTTNNDPTNAGRIKCQIPEVGGKEYPEWIEPVFVPGWFSPPEPGDQVEIEVPEGGDLVEFAHEIRYHGRVFDESNIPPDDFKQTEDKVHRRGYFTKAGHLLMFDDKSGSEQITLKHANAMLLTITTDGIFIGSEGASEPLVLGALWKTLESSFLDAFINHFHATGVGPSGPPEDPIKTTVTNLKTGVDNSDQLSDFVKTQKVKP